MGFFTRYQKIDEERLLLIESRLKKLENEVLGLATGQEVIRNKVLKKIQFKRADEEPDRKDLYNQVLIPEQ